MVWPGLAPVAQAGPFAPSWLNAWPSLAPFDPITQCAMPPAACRLLAACRVQSLYMGGGDSSALAAALAPLMVTDHVAALSTSLLFYAMEAAAMLAILRDHTGDANSAVGGSGGGGSVGRPTRHA